ncbi:MAG TPA: Fur family transcriptional regulator [Candidatus Limnocylindria bacterium]
MSSLPEPWGGVPARFRARRLRWTPQRQVVVRVLAESDGHLTGVELVERCRAADPNVIPSTVYRTLDVLEEFGLVRHAHGAGGQEEYHVQPLTPHGHRYCDRCGRHWNIEPASGAGRAIARAFRGEDFAVDLSHVVIVGRCAACRGATGG